MDSALYLAAKNIFKDEVSISTATLQRYFQVPYYQARVVLDSLIRIGFCEEQVGSKPCRVISNEKN